MASSARLARLTRSTPAALLGLAAAFAGLACGGLAFAGCGYSAGFKPRAGIRSVAIPIFENRSLRRELEFPLTEAVVRELQRRTPLRLTSREKADVTLLGTIEAFDQPVLVEGRRDEVLESSAVVTLSVRATDREGRELFRYAGSGTTPDVTGPALVESAQFTTARGEALGTPTADTFVDLAERVVMLLEERMAEPARERP